MSGLCQSLTLADTHDDVPLLTNPTVSRFAIKKCQKLRIVLDLISGQQNPVCGLAGIFDCA